MPVEQSRLLIGVTFDRQAAQQQKAPAVFELMPRIGEKAVNARQRKAVARNCLGGLSWRCAWRSAASTSPTAASVSATIQLRSATKSAARQALASLAGAVEDGRRGVACDAVRAKGASLHRYGSFHEIA